MSEEFDAAKIDALGWRQGAILGPELAGLARERAPKDVSFAGDDILIVTSHDCDLVHQRLEGEPVIEVLRAASLSHPDRMKVGGRNPRSLQLELDGGTRVSCSVHERWSIPRSLLTRERPAMVLPPKTRRLVAEWLAKRYIRAAFPSNFDNRWRGEQKTWTKLLEKHNATIQAVYLRLSTSGELAADKPYLVHVLVAVPAARRAQGGWARSREDVDRDVRAFWSGFSPGIVLVDVEVLGNDEITLADLEPYLRFDADWLSFADEAPVVPIATDLRT